MTSAPFGPVTPELLDQLRAAVGPEHVLTEREALAPLGRDETEDLQGEPEAAVFPDYAVADTALHARAVPDAYAAKVAELAARFDLSPALIEAVVWQESRWHAGARSPVGARGLAQLMPGTAREMGVKAEDFNRFGSSLVFGHPQGPTGTRLVMEMIEELAMRGGGHGLFVGCAAGDSAAAIVLQVG